jgi:L-histidine N-alpha-methyltransferase
LSTAESESLSSEGLRAQFIRDVREGLSRPGQKELPSRHLYDALGSALFEAITLLPEYGLTRADERVLSRCARQVRERIPRDPLIVELGSGSGRKTRLLLEVFGPRPSYAPIDISSAALQQCQKELSPLAQVTPIHARYLDGVQRASAGRLPGQPLLLLFLGSTIGNFSPAEAATFLRALRSRLRPGDALLLGADLRKDPARLLGAYDDPTGVTAAFNRNVLGRVNRELGGDFDLAAFTHQARYDQAAGRVEMHLVAQRAMDAHIPAAGLAVSLQQGETIWTESSHKFHLEDLVALTAAAAFGCEARWVDEEWPFCEALCVAA